MQGRICIITLALVAGCTELPPPVPPATNGPSAAPTSAFDRESAGVIRGQVCWDGAAPTALEQSVRAHASNPYLNRNPAHFVLPHYPKIDAKSKGIEHAVVYLRTVDPKQARPWDHAPARVEIRARKLHVLQGERSAAVGFVQRGDCIESVNRDVDYHNLLGRGSAFFAVPLIHKDRVSKQKLDKPGIVELRSGNGYFWLHGHLFVADHPYFACTDESGRFTLDKVPAGNYELVCWMPSWQIRRKEHDPETGTLIRLAWHAPVEQTRMIEVQAGHSTEAEFRWTMAAFAPTN